MPGKFNQLFAAPVPEDLIEAVVHAFGLDSLDDARYFSRWDVMRVGAADAVAKLVPALEEYYLPCKAKIYLRDLTHRSVMTVLRQVLRFVDRCTESREVNTVVYGKPSKLLMHSVRKIGKPPPHGKMNKLHGRYTLDFDQRGVTHPEGRAASRLGSEAASEARLADACSTEARLADAQNAASASTAT